MKTTFHALLKTVRRKLQLERLLVGIFLVVAFLLAGTLLATFFLSRQNFSDSALLWTRLFLGAGLIFLVARHIIYRLWRRPSERRIARFLEERHPELQDRVSTAVHLDRGDSDVHPEIRQLIRQDANEKLKAVPQPRFYRPRLTGSVIVTGLVLMVVLSVLSISGPEVYRYSLKKIFASWLDRDPGPLYKVLVTPGDTTVAERADLQVRASLQGFQANEAYVFAKYADRPQWEQARMAASASSGEFTFVFFDIRDPLQYYVESGGVRSDTFAVEVSDVPKVTGLVVELDFPDYTGMENAVLQETGDITALVGTTATLTIQTDQPVESGVIRFENGTDVPLVPDEAGQLVGSFKVDKADYYRGFLANSEGVLSPATDEFYISPTQDQIPSISFLRPGRDVKVTNIEEVFSEVKVEDDHGIRNVKLRFSVNGSEEQEATLKVPRGSKSATASHTFYLEEFDLQPGDFISYYGQAADAVSHATSDMYFLEVVPFEREFYQSQQSGQQGDMGNEMDLARQQKQIIVATFSLDSDSERYSKEEFKENSQTLGLLQQRLQEQANTIIQRIERRGAAASNPRFQKMVEYLKKAAEFMLPAEKHLNEVDPARALPHEKSAYQQLMRAEALFKEVQVSLSQNPGNQGASAEDLADLVDLELDRTKNQYETLQQNQQARQAQAIDDALEKLKELARRQEQQVERALKQAAQQGGGSGGSMSQQQLIEEVEKLARELARLSRQKQDQQLAEIGRQLDRTAREMRKSQQSGQTQQSLMQAQQALERLKRARQALSGHRGQQARQQLNELRSKAEQLAQRQEEVVESLRELEEKGQELTPESFQQTRNLLGEKQDLQNELRGLEGSLHQTARQLESREKQTARKLKQAGNSIRDNRIPEKMEEGTQLAANRLFNMARQREEGIGEELDTLAQTIRAAEQSLGTGQENSPEERLQRALSEAGSLIDRLESLQEKAESTQAGSGPDQQQQPGRQESSEASEDGSQPSQQANRPGETSESSQPGQQSRPQTSQGRSSAEGNQQVGPSSREARASGSSASTGIDPQQLGREWQERIAEAERLQELVSENPELARDVSGLIRQMRQLDMQRVLEDPEEVAQLKSTIIDGFHQLELDLSQQLDQDMDHLLRLVSESDVPPEFRERVEEYYRRLSQKKPPE